jgi:hypothetical protein
MGNQFGDEYAGGRISLSLLGPTIGLRNPFLGWWLIVELCFGLPVMLDN